MEQFDDEMLRLIANPSKSKVFQKDDNDDTLYRNMSYKYKQYRFTHKKFEYILQLIETYLKKISIEEFVEDIIHECIDETIQDVQNNCIDIEIYDETRNHESFSNIRTIQLG